MERDVGAELARELLEAARSGPSPTTSYGTPGGSARSTSEWRLRATRWPAATTAPPPAVGAGGRSVPRWTTRTSAAGTIAATPALFASTIRAAPNVCSTGARQRLTVKNTSPPWTETTSGSARPARRTASPAGTALCAWTRSNAWRRSARPRAGAAHRPHAPYVGPRGGEAKDTYSIGSPSSSARRGWTSLRRSAPSEKSAFGGTSRWSTNTRTSAPASRAARACLCAHTPRTGSSARG